MSGSQSTGVLSANATYTLDLYRARRQRGAVRNRLGQAGSAHCHAERGPERREERRQRDADLVLDQCDLVQRLGRLVGNQERDWIPVHGRPHQHVRLHADLHRHRRQRRADRDGHGQRITPRPP